MKTKSETKTRKPAAREDAVVPREDAVVLEYALVMFDINGEIVQEIRMEYIEYSGLKLHRCLWETTETTDEPAIDEGAPEWLETPDCDYILAIWFEDGDELTRTSLTRAQYIQLKEELASERARRAAKAAAA